MDTSLLRNVAVEERYPAFPKIPRLRRTIIITENISRRFENRSLC